MVHAQYRGKSAGIALCLAAMATSNKDPRMTLCKTSGGYLELSADAITGVIVGNRADLDTDLPVVQARIADDEYKVIIP